MAPNAKDLQELSLLKSIEKNMSASDSAPCRAALTPARRDEIIDRIAIEWKETFDLLERYDAGEILPDLNSI